MLMIIKPHYKNVKFIVRATAVYNAKSTQCIQPPQTFAASELVSHPAISCPANWSVNFMSCYFMSFNFDGPLFSRPSLLVNP